MAEGRHCCPRWWDIGHEVVVGSAWEEGLIAVALRIVAAVFLDVVRVRSAELRIYGRDDDHA